VKQRSAPGTLREFGNECFEYLRLREFGDELLDAVVAVNGPDRDGFKCCTNTGFLVNSCGSPYSGNVADLNEMYTPFTHPNT
jgi:hypothetical protein